MHIENPRQAQDAAHDRIAIIDDSIGCQFGSIWNYNKLKSISGNKRQFNPRNCEIVGLYFSVIVVAVVGQYTYHPLSYLMKIKKGNLVLEVKDKLCAMTLVQTETN